MRGEVQKALAGEARVDVDPDGGRYCLTRAFLVRFLGRTLEVQAVLGRVPSYNTKGRRQKKELGGDLSDCAGLPLDGGRKWADPAFVQNLTGHSGGGILRRLRLLGKRLRRRWWQGGG